MDECVAAVVADSLESGLEPLVGGEEAAVVAAVWQGVAFFTSSSV
jgi:hypothetical protein